jgi:sterol desaturase/sphingolipid hydroxylase (fatty acid hydroxylase superfamily)
MFLEAAGRLLQFLIARFEALFLGPGSSLSAASLVSALCIAVLFLVARRPQGKRQVKYRVIVRALFPRWLRRPSFRADIRFLLLNVLASAMLVGWAIVSARAISDIVSAALTGVFGALPGTGLNELTIKSIATAFMFLAYEFAYWFDHYLSHRIPLLWDFHRVHHTAEVLSPLTNFRVHPVDSLVFGNILGLSMGITGGVLTFLQLGSPFEVGGTNLILVAFFFVTVHLQHSHVWIATTGLLGRVIMSPAHHQIHHSDSPKHFNKNFGSCLSIWDWMFGTLHVPDRKRERLTFGVATRAREHHTAVGSLLLPFVQAAKRLRPRPTRVRRVVEADRAA